MEILVNLEVEAPSKQTAHPPRNKNVIVTTPHYRRLAHLDSNGVWRWTHGKDLIREQIISWDLL